MHLTMFVLFFAAFTTSTAICYVCQISNKVSEFKMQAFTLTLAVNQKKLHAKHWQNESNKQKRFKLKNNFNLCDGVGQLAKHEELCQHKNRKAAALVQRICYELLGKCFSARKCSYTELKLASSYLLCCLKLLLFLKSHHYYCLKSISLNLQHCAWCIMHAYFKDFLIFL